MLINKMLKMYKNNNRNSSKLKGFSPPQLSCDFTECDIAKKRTLK